jgi:preprotein translocase subunit YajC
MLRFSSLSPPFYDDADDPEQIESWVPRTVAWLARSARGRPGWKNAGDNLGFFNPMNLLLLSALVVYLLLIVPSSRASRKTRKELEEKLANLKKNDRVVTSFGVHGVVAGIHSESNTVTLRIDENTNAKMTVTREAIHVVNKD